MRTALTLARHVVPRTVRYHLWAGYAVATHDQLRKRLLRIPTARLALSLAVLRTYSRRRHRSPTGVERLQGLFVINLAHRPERLAGFMSEMERLGIESVERFDAISNPLGILGCNQSHAALIRRMIDSGWACVMICEDDARFRVTRNELDALIDAFLADHEAEVACLGYFDETVEARNALYMRATRSLTTACYIVKESIARDLLTVWEDASRQLEASGDRTRYGLDIAWISLQKARVFVIPVIRAVDQEPGWSDIWKRHAQYSFWPAEPIARDRP